MQICDYGCGQEGKYILKNNKACCSAHYNTCTATRKRNSDGLKIAYANGKKKNTFTDAHIQTSVINKQNTVTEDIINGGSVYRSNHYLKKIIKERNLLEWSCSECKIEKWNNKEIILELDHINGDAANNNLENLRLLCPNCHSQTGTFRGRSINTGKKKVSDEELIQSLKMSKNIRQALINVGLSPRGGNYTRASKLQNGKTIHS
jgi:Zn finger protein HypA/HybF involved in hydrogenase expression